MSKKNEFYREIMLLCDWINYTLMELQEMDDEDVPDFAVGVCMSAQDTLGQIMAEYEEP